MTLLWSFFRETFVVGSLTFGGGYAMISALQQDGWAKLEAVYCVAGLGSGYPQSQAGPRRNLAEASR